MKIVCDSCGAKYSIADEKVQGKVFKIRCKKCSNVIVVKGSAEAEAADDAGGSAAEWYVVIDGEQVGPVTTVEIDSYFMSGQINAETYAWKDGMGDWRHIVEIPEFAHLGQDTAGPNEATQIAESPRYDTNDVDSTNVVNSPLAMGGNDQLDSTIGDPGYNDPYPSDPGYGDDDYGYGGDDGGGYGDDGGYSGFAGSYGDGGGVGGELAAAGGDDGGGMFAAFDAGGSDDFMSFGGSADDSAPAEPAGAAIGDNLVGQRNENSVLFSLSSLDSVPAVGGEGKEDVPVTEGSGLIDIQALASAHKSMSSSSDGDGGIDPFAQGTMAMPALMPMGSHRNNNTLYIAIGVAAFALLGLGGIAIYALTRDDPQPQTIIKEVHTKEIVEAAPVDKDKAAAEADEAEKAAKEAAAADPKKVEEEEPAEKEDDGKKAASSSKSSSSKKSSSSSKSDPDPEPVKKDPPKKKDGIDSILDKIDDKAEAASKKEESSSSSKKSLSRSDVKQTINRYNSRINTCAKSQNSSKKTGTVKVKFYIRPNGRVRGEQVVSSGFKGTDVGRCVEKVVGSMTFPKTSASKDVPVTYPFIIK